MVHSILIGIGFAVVTCAQGQICGVPDPTATPVQVTLAKINESSDGVIAYKGHLSLKKDPARLEVDVYDFARGTSHFYEIDSTFVTPSGRSDPTVLKGRDLETMGDVTFQGPAVIDSEGVHYPAATVGGTPQKAREYARR